MPKHSVADWNMSKDVQLANIRGFSPLEKLPKLLKEAYPDLVPFKFGFFVEDDRPDRYTDGWVHLTTDDFPSDDIQNLNTALSNKGAWTEETSQTKKIGDITDKVKLRFNILADPAGRIKYKKNFVMIQPLDYFQKRRDKMHEINKRAYESEAEKEKGAPIADGFANAEVQNEESRGPIGAVKRGRPRSK